MEYSIGLEEAQPNFCSSLMRVNPSHVLQRNAVYLLYCMYTCFTERRKRSKEAVTDGGGGGLIQVNESVGLFLYIFIWVQLMYEWAQSR
jgi:hypothetical protein